MIFYSGSHQKFYNDNLAKAKKKDCYTKSLIYTLGIMEETRNNFTKIYDIEKNEIIHESINLPFQTSGSISLTRLAFNLFNDTYFDVCNVEDEKDNTPNAIYYTPVEIFKHWVIMPYLFEAVRLRFNQADETVQEIDL